MLGLMSLLLHPGITSTDKVTNAWKRKLVSAKELHINDKMSKSEIAMEMET